MTTLIVDDTAARRTACNALLHTYDAAKATMDQMRAYSSCVDFLYPPASIQATKFGILLWLLCIGVGIALGAALSHDREVGAFTGGIIGFIGVPVVALIWWTLT